eukprot:jgi/Chrpa1/26913/Chrysochromulina_OHIO_Genome00009578-RA
MSDPLGQPTPSKPPDLKALSTPPKPPPSQPLAANPFDTPPRAQPMPAPAQPPPKAQPTKAMAPTTSAAAQAPTGQPKMSAAARMRLAAEAAEAAEAAKHRKPLILKAAVKQVEVAPPPPEMAFLESVGARIERCEKEGQIDLAVSIYRTALPMFNSALEHGGPYTGTILAVREEAFAILKMASKRLKAKVESGTIKGSALDETIKRAALIDAALKDTPPPPQPKVVAFAHGWRGERAQRLALRHEEKAHEEKARGESVLKEPVTGSEEPNMDLDRAGFEADKFVAHLLQTKTMKEVVNYRDTMHAENKQMISAIIGNATMLAEQLDARGHAEKLEKDNQEAALVYEQFVVVDMDGWMRATGQIRKKICSRFEELDAMVDELDRSIRGVSSETLRLESHLYRPIKVKLDEGNRTKQNLAKVQFVGSLPKTLQGCVQNGEFDLAAKYYALGLKLLDVVDRSAQKAAEKAREAAEQAKSVAEKVAAEKAAKLMIDGDAPIGLTAEELAMMIYLQENSSDSSASDPSAATFAATVKIRDECAMIMHTARLRLEMRLEERGLNAAARSDAKLSLGLIDCAIRGDAKGFDLGQDLGHLAKEVSWISREIRMEANLVMHSARLRLESKLAEPDLTSRGIQETKAQLKKVEQMLHTALVTTLQRCVQEGRLERALEYYAQEVPPESPEAARNPFEAGAETFESSMREEARSILSTARLRLIASLEEEELAEEDRL